MILDVLILLVLFNYNDNCEIDIIINILQMRDLGLRLNNPTLGQLQQVTESGFSHLVGLTGITMLFT